MRNRHKNTAAFFVNKETQKSKFQKKLELTSSLIPKGSYKPSKPSEDLMRPRTIKEEVSKEREEMKVSFDLNPKYHPMKKKK